MIFPIAGRPSRTNLHRDPIHRLNMAGAMWSLRRFLVNEMPQPPAGTAPAAPPSRAAKGIRWPDVLLALALAIANTALAYRNGIDLNPALYHWAACDAYFDADSPRALLDMTGRFNDHYRTRVHPLFPLLAIPPQQVIEKALGLSEIEACRLLTACVGGLWAAGLFTLFRLVGCRRLDATMFSALAMTSGAAMLFFIVPDTYAFGSLSVVAALLVVALARHGRVSPMAAIAVSAFTLSVTVTNFMAGLAMAVCSYPLRKALWISLAAVAVVLALWCVERALMPSVRFPLSGSEEAQYILQEESGGPLRISAAFFLHTMVTPQPIVLTRDLSGFWTQVLSVQRVNPGAGGLAALIAVMLWTGLLVIGGLAILAKAVDPRFGAALVLVLAGQLALHLVYGSETIVYSLHFAPLLLTVAAIGSLTRLRAMVLAFAAVVTVLAWSNNLETLRRAKAFLDQPHQIAPDTASTAPASAAGAVNRRRGQ
jgi:hypothetical protein